MGRSPRSIRNIGSAVTTNRWTISFEWNDDPSQGGAWQTYTVQFPRDINLLGDELQGAVIDLLTRIMRVQNVIP